jgi:hypothetical protein
MRLIHRKNVSFENSNVIVINVYLILITIMDNFNITMHHQKLE